MTGLYRWIAPACLSLALFAGLATAADEKGVLKVEDNAGVFSAEGIDKAKAAMADTTFHARTHLTVVTYGTIPAGKREAYDRAKGKDTDKKRFFSEWALEVAKAKKAEVLVFISMEGTHIRALDDRQTDVSRSFGSDDLKTLERKFTNGFASAKSETDVGLQKSLHDTALNDGVNFVVEQLKDTTVPVNGTKAAATKAAESKGGMGGGGFMTSLMGGMFGAVAGHYLYDNFFGGSHSSPASAGDAGGGYGNNNTTDTGAGDYDGGGDSGGSDFGGGGDAGGADFGGGSDFGGGDTGGGGDFGGGGDW